MSEQLSGDAPEGGTNRSNKPQKRIRVSQACEQCRTKKGKCDGRQPTCSVCEANGIECSYDPKPKKRGLRPGQHSQQERRGILAELVAAYLMSLIPDAEQSVASFFCIDDSDLPFLSPGIRRSELEGTFSQWRRTSIPRWLIETSARTDPALDQLSNFRSQAASDPGIAASNPGETADAQEMAPMTDVPHVNSTHIPMELGCIQVDQQQPRSSISVANSDYDGREMRSNFDALHPLPSQMSQVFEMYFGHTHTWLPLVDKFKLTAFCRSFPTAADRANPMDASRSGNLALIWAIVAYVYMHTPDSCRATGFTTPPTIPAEAASRAMAFIPTLDAEFENEHVQALILLALFYLKTGHSKLSWRIIGLAGRIAVDISSVQPGTHLSSASRRTSLVCFAVEGLVAASLGLKSQLPSIQGHNSLKFDSASSQEIQKLEAGGWEEWSAWEIPGFISSPSFPPEKLKKEPFHVLSVFNQSVLLIELLNTAIEGKMSKKGTLTHSTSLDIIQNGPPELAEWKSRTVEICPLLAPQRTDQDSLPHLISMQALYWAVRGAFHLQMTPARKDEPSYRHEASKIASNVNNLALRYQSIYPSYSSPLGLTTSIAIALRLIDTEGPLNHSLTKVLSAAQYNGTTEEALTGLFPFSQQHVNIMPRHMQDSSFPERQTKRLKSNIESQGHGLLATRHSSAHHHNPTLQLNVQEQNFDITMLEGLDFSDPTIALGDAASLSTNDLTELDAAVWTDELFTRNLGFIEDTPTAIDSDLSYVFDPFAPL